MSEQAVIDAIKQSVRPMTGDEVETPFGAYLGIEGAVYSKPGGTPYRVVRLSARIIDWPYECPCCGAEPDGRFMKGFVLKNGRRVIRQPASDWLVPFCPQCVEQVCLAREAKRWREEALQWQEKEAQAQRSYEARSPVLPSHQTQPVDTPGVFHPNLDFPPQPTSPVDAWAKRACAALCVIWLVGWVGTREFVGGFVLAFLCGFPLLLISSKVTSKWNRECKDKAMEDWRRDVEIIKHQRALAAQGQLPTLPGDHPPRPNPAPAVPPSKEVREAVEQAQKAKRLEVALQQELNKRNQQVGISAQCAIYKWRPVGSVYSYIFAREEYGLLFAMANGRKVIYNEQRSL